MNVIYYTYDVDSSLISMNLNGTEYFYITNLQGDIIELVDINAIPLYNINMMLGENFKRYRHIRCFPFKKEPISLQRI